MTVEEKRALKAHTLAYLPHKLARTAALMEATDPRLRAYCEEVAHGAESLHNLYEVLAVSKFCTLLEEYEWREDEVRRFFALYEQIEFNGAEGRERHLLTPVQAFQFASVFGFWRADGTRLVRQAILFVPRKFGKTTSVAALAVRELLYGDANAQAYMAANSQQQSELCFREAKSIVRQLDPLGRRFRTTANVIGWRTPNAYGRESYCERLTAGARTKDGLNASLVIFDEYAAARYVKDHSDGAELLHVLSSSMGTRANPLTVIITTANRVNGGPFEQVLEGAKGALEQGDCPWQFASLFLPDPWEMDEESFGRESVWRKCNPHIGVTVRPDFYAAEWEQARRDPEKHKEFLCKYLNVFQSDKVRDWIAPDTVRRLQGARRVTDLDPERERWVCFVGMDFSRGDDLCGQVYLCYSATERRFFADLDVWVTEQTLLTHTNGVLYRQWAAEGWLHVCPGAVIPESVVTDAAARVARHANILRFGYDPYDAKAFINYLSAWIRSMRGNPSRMVRSVRQTWGQFNSACQYLERAVAMRAVEFSPSPLWPWCFGNAVLEEDKFENVKPVKRTANGKIDPVICLLEGLILFEEANDSK